jgi:hypothetical protein
LLSFDHVFFTALHHRRPHARDLRAAVDDNLGGAHTAAPGPLFPTTTSAPASSAVVYTPEQMSGIINDLVTAVQGIRLFLIGSQGPPTPP